MAPQQARDEDLAAAARWGLDVVDGVDHAGLSVKQGLVHHGHNSGYQAINLAFLEGADRILLLGFDMRLGTGGKRHWFGDHPGRLNKKSPYHDMLAAFRTMARDAAELGLEIVNCSPGTALTCFPCMSLDEGLAWIGSRR